VNVSTRLVSHARSALTGRPFVEAFGFALGGLLFDLLSLDLMFLTLGYQPGFGPLAVMAVLAVLGHRIVNYWLPLFPGALAYLHLRLHPNVRRKAIPKCRHRNDRSQ
jgi:uncharacterized membrane protein YbhN (UPF0104 family)